MKTKKPIMKDAQKEKEKLKYNVWQNSVYVIKAAWARDKTVLLVVLAQILLTVAISVVALYLPKTVVAQITGHVSVHTLTMTVLGFTAVTVLLQAAKRYLDDTAQPRRAGLRVSVGHDILSKIIETDFTNLEKKDFTDAKQKANDVTGSNNTATEQIYYTFANLGANGLGFVVYIVLLIAVNPWVLLITAATTLVGVWARNRANRWRHAHDAESAGYNKRLNYVNWLGNNYNMAKDIRLFAMADWLKDIYDAYLKLSCDLSRRVQIRQLAADAADLTAAFLREGIAYAYLIGLVLNAGLPVDQFVLLFAAIGGFSGWITGILSEYATLSRHSMDYCRLREYLEYPDVFNRDDGEPLQAEPDAAYALELRNVSFRYTGATENTLENINLTLHPGEKLAVVGLNGAGKTTLVKLLCGLYDPTEGTVLLNGRDIRVFNRKHYYALFTAVFQEFNILPMTIAENVSQLTSEEADHDKVMRCLTQADLADKIKALPGGTSAWMLKSVNEDAVEFSGGETQKLMLARALYKMSPVLLLDEPTAALDPIAESRLYQRYNELSAGRTSIYISHRLASTRFCDRIILIGHKTIAESGTHDELMKQGGQYAELFEIQSKYYKDGEGSEII